jgi:hypothetical protein
MKYILILILLFFTGCINQQNNKLQIVQYKDTNKILPQPSTKEFIIEDNNIINNNNNTIAIVYASNEIGKYAIDATNTASTYLLNTQQNFDLKIYDIGIENKNNIISILDKLKDNNISKIVLMITNKDVKYLFDYKGIKRFEIYLPLVFNNYPNSPDNIYYGGINYKNQFNYISKNVNSNIIEIYDDTIFGNMLHKDILESNLKNNLIKSIKLKGKSILYSRIMKQIKKIKHSTVILNTSIIKSSIFLSQLRANDIQVDKIYSTQVNFSPLLLVLTQKEDRKDLIVLNSIPTLPKKLEAINSIMGNDILYNWVNYSILLGMSYFINNHKLLNNMEFINHQIDYTIKSYDLSGYNFSKL